MKQKVLFTLSIFLLAVLMLQPVTEAVPIRADLPGDIPAPSLQIMKWVSTYDQIEPGQDFSVYVNITNFGKYAAYNLTIDEPSFANFTIDTIKNYEEHKWITIYPNATFSYLYTFKFEREGDFTIGATSVDYTDINGSAYSAISQPITITVSVTPPPITKTVQWRILGIWMGAIIALPLITFLLKKYLW